MLLARATMIASRRTGRSRSLLVLLLALLIGVCVSFTAPATSVIAAAGSIYTYDGCIAHSSAVADQAWPKSRAETLGNEHAVLAAGHPICAARAGFAAEDGETELVQRAMSRAELQATQDRGLIRGGREGTSYVSDNVNSNALRARQRLALPQTPEVRVTLEVPKGAFSPPKLVDPRYGMPGGGMERMGTGQIACRVVAVLDYC